jgi:choline dehydrogenase
VLRWATTGKGVLTWSPGMMSLFSRTQDGLEAPDVQINGGPVSWAEGRIGVPESEPGFTLGVWQCRPHSRGTVTPRSPHAEDAPAIAPRFLTERADEDCVVRGMRLARRWMAAEPLRGIVAHEVRPGPQADTDDAMLAFAKATGGTVYHPSCTVRMGGDDAAPLDARLRLRGVDGLRVVDASVFPVVPSANTNFPTLMTAEKMSDAILAGAA